MTTAGDITIQDLAFPATTNAKQLTAQYKALTEGLASKKTKAKPQHTMACCPKLDLCVMRVFPGLRPRRLSMSEVKKRKRHSPEQVIVLLLDRCDFWLAGSDIRLAFWGAQLAGSVAPRAGSGIRRGCREGRHVVFKEIGAVWGWAERNGRCGLSGISDEGKAGEAKRY